MGRLAQNLMLAANPLGVGSCPVTFHRSDDAAKVLGLPEGAICRYGIAFGYPAEGQNAGQVRRPQTPRRVRPLEQLLKRPQSAQAASSTAAIRVDATSAPVASRSDRW